MFIKKQTEENREKYFKLLQIMGGLSNLFSESAVPFLHYRVSENIFCKAFSAENLSRSDCSADAKKEIENLKIGVGIKTFIEGSGSTYQKIAEFNRSRLIFEKFIDDSEKLVHEISNMRNSRIETTQKMFGIDSIVYHCIARSENRFRIYEESMNPVDMENIRNISKNGNSVFFDDKKENYLFNLSKSTLFKKFNTGQADISIPVNIIEDPYEALYKIFADSLPLHTLNPAKSYGSIILPLYSTRTKETVPEKSGLNQWNAGGRLRDSNEVYIPVPSWIHLKFPGFFPDRETPFKLKLPDGTFLDAKICQDNGKALMSSPNNALGIWLLRDILRLREGELATYEKLAEIGIDSVEIEKSGEGSYSINFKQLGTFEDFKDRYRDNI